MGGGSGADTGALGISKIFDFFKISPKGVLAIDFCVVRMRCFYDLVMDLL